MTNKYIIIGTGQKNNVLNEAFYEVINNKIKNAMELGGSDGTN